ncbi:MAG: hypothetical protein DHS20C03_04840 [Minwuia thermotolerans]|nr:MAG: hypothetical protein DHS20C03_04840 [Minwuia thermotolerans]
MLHSSLERLNHEQHWVRLGAVFVLEQIAETEPELSDSVVSVLVTYLGGEMEKISESQILHEQPEVIEIWRFLANIVSEAQ